MAIDVDGQTGNGVQLLERADGRHARRSTRATRSTPASQWRAHSDDLAAMRSRADSAFADTSYAVIAWRGARRRRPTKQTYDFSTDTLVPAGHARRRVPRAAVVGRRQHDLLRHRAARAEGPAERRAPGELPPARVQVWHWKDVREFHQQEVNASAGSPAHDARRVARRVEPTVARLSRRSATRPFRSRDERQRRARDGRGAVRARVHVGPRRIATSISIDLATGKRNEDPHQVAVRRDAEPERPSTRSISRTGSGGRSISRAARAANLTGKIKQRRS